MESAVKRNALNSCNWSSFIHTTVYTSLAWGGAGTETIRETWVWAIEWVLYYFVG